MRPARFGVGRRVRHGPHGPHGPMRCASLGMYDMPWLHDANDVLWRRIRDHLRVAGVDDVPSRLDRDRPLDKIWRDPGLLLAQTCGLPLIMALRDKVRLVATPHYDFRGCEGPFYCSFVIVRSDSRFATVPMLRGCRAVINDFGSQSGMNALRQLVAPFADWRDFFNGITVSGGHQQSIEAVVTGVADVAAIDCVTYGLLAAHGWPHLARTRILCRTRAVPGLPLITAAATSDATLGKLRQALRAVLRDHYAASARAALHFTAVSDLEIGDYQKVT